MSSLRTMDRASLCHFRFSDNRQCRTPRTGNHPHFCHYHARKDSQSRAAGKLSRDLTYLFSGEYVCANDLSVALARVLPAVIRGDVKPRAARTVAYLAQTLLQTIQLAQHEYINARGAQAWRQSIDTSISQNAKYDLPNPANPPEATAPAPPAHPNQATQANPSQAATNVNPASPPTRTQNSGETSSVPNPSGVAPDLRHSSGELVSPSSIQQSSRSL